MKKLLLLFTTILLFSCAQEEKLIENNDASVELYSDACVTFNTANALYPNNVITINPSLNLEEQIDDGLEGIDIATEGVTFYFEEGTHNINTSIINTDLNFTGFNGGIEIVGDGGCTILLQTGTNVACSVLLIDIEHSKDITIHNLVIDGNRNNLCGTPGGEQGNNIRIRNSENILVKNISSINANGDAINIGCSDNIVIEDNHFDFANRNGLTLGHGTGDQSNPFCALRNLTIKRNEFGSEIDTQYIDFEHGDTYSGVQILNNDFLKRNTIINTGSDDQYAIAVTKFDQDSIIDNIIAGNDFHSNRLTIIDSEHLVVRFNDNIGNTSLLKGNNEILIRGNSFYIEPYQTNVPGSSFNQGILIGRSVNPATTNVQLNNNTINISKFERGIEIWNANDIQIKNNTITNINIGDDQAINGIQLYTKYAGNSTTANLTGNTFSNWTCDVEIAEHVTATIPATCTGGDCGDCNPTNN